jgi:hypothetical protein
LHGKRVLDKLLLLLTAHDLALLVKAVVLDGDVLGLTFADEGLERLLLADEILRAVLLELLFTRLGRVERIVLVGFLLFFEV